MKNTINETFSITMQKDDHLFTTVKWESDDLCFKLHVLDESSCDCGEEYEDSYHYFMEYPNFTELRFEHLNTIAPYF